MVDSVERRGQVRVQRPHPLGPRALGGGKDRLCRVLAAATRSEPITLGLEPGLPLGLQPVTDPTLMAAVRNHGDTQRTQLRTISRFRYVHSPYRQGPPSLTLGMHLHRQLHPGRGGQSNLPINPSRRATGIPFVTCRTLTNVFDQLFRSNFCRFLTFARSPSCVALKIRCRSPVSYTHLTLPTKR